MHADTTLRIEILDRESRYLLSACRVSLQDTQKAVATASTWKDMLRSMTWRG